VEDEMSVFDRAIASISLWLAISLVRGRAWPEMRFG
jgi:hypothetical protein